MASPFMLMMCFSYDKASQDTGKKDRNGLGHLIWHKSDDLLILFFLYLRATFINALGSFLQVHGGPCLVLGLKLGSTRYKTSPLYIVLSLWLDLCIS